MSGQQSSDLEVVNLSDVGRNRPHNEDSTASDADWGLMVVADGMGGYRAGEVASALAITVMLRRVYPGLDRIDHTGARKDEQPMEGYMSLLREATEEANRAVHQASREIQECKGMGTTMVAAVFRHGRVSVAHVGDSRMYRLRDSALQQITKDHSLYQEVIDKGLCTPQEALDLTNKSLVTRALGVKPEVEVDVKQEHCLQGDIYLLCSDGLNDMLRDRDIHLTLKRYEADLQQAGTELVALANQRGGKDNISVVLVRVNAVAAESNEDNTTPSARTQNERHEQDQQEQPAEKVQVTREQIGVNG